MRGWRAHVIVFVTAATLLMPASALAQVAYLCTMTGSLGSSCRCPAATHEAAAARSRAALERPDCCRAQARPSREALAAASGNMPVIGAATLAATLSIAQLRNREPIAALAGAMRASGPPAIGPPIYLENCRLLR